MSWENLATSTPVRSSSFSSTPTSANKDLIRAAAARERTLNEKLLSANDEVARLTEAVSALEVKNKRLEEKLEQSLARELQLAKGSVESQPRSFGDPSTLAVDLSTKIDAEKKINSDLKADLERCREQMHALELESEEKSREIQMLVGQIKHMDSKLEMEASDRVHAEASSRDVPRLKLQLESLQRECNTKTAYCQKLEEDLENLQHIIEVLKSSSAEAEEGMVQMQAQLREKEQAAMDAHKYFFERG